MYCLYLTFYEETLLKSYTIFSTALLKCGMGTLGVPRDLGRPLGRSFHNNTKMLFAFCPLRVEFSKVDRM
jgi:hypothetical protein